LAPAPRLRELGGVRLGVLDNSKWNANRLLRKIADRLAQKVALTTVNYYRKETFARVADPALLARIATENDIVLTAIGD
jgi:hypothetical protein